MKKNLLFLIVIFISVQVFAQVDLTKGLFLNMPLNGNIQNNAGQTQFTVKKAGSWTSDRFGNPNGAYSFSADSTWLTTNNFIVPPEFTISVWVKPYAAYQQAVILNIGNSAIDGFGITMSSGNNGSGNKLLLTASGIVYDMTGSTETLAQNTWQHIIVTRKADNFYVYKDAVLNSSGKDITNKDNGVFNLGSSIEQINNSGKSFDGAMDDISFYNRALSDSEITALNKYNPAANNCIATFSYKISGNEVEFEGDITKNNAQANYHWTFGDGSQSYSRISKHSYNSPGVYQVCLKVSYAGCTDTKCDSVIIAKPVINFSISGYVHTDNISADVGNVYLIYFNPQDSTLQAIDTSSFITDTSGGYYNFSYIKPGKYLVKAALKTISLNYDTYLPTYSDSALKWDDAEEIEVINGSKFGDIYMKNGLNPGGTGFISGKVSQGANKQEGDPLENIQVMLLDKNLKPVAYTYTDAGGSFSFAKLALGRYQVYTEVAGFITLPNWVMLTEENPKEDNIEIRINSKSIVTLLENEKEMPVNNFIIYPNPVINKNFNINFSAANSSGNKLKELEIISITGQVIFVKILNNEADTYNVVLPGNTKPGMYIVKCRMENRFIQQLIVVQ